MHSLDQISVSGIVVRISALIPLLSPVRFTRGYSEADRLKANLALLGVESSIQQVKVNNGNTWNRVRIGPIKDLTALSAMCAKLAQNHIEPLVIKIN